MTDTKNCLIYTRVSTQKQAQYGESPEEQELICCRIAAEQKLTVLKVFNEQFSGREEERPVINEVFAYIEKSPKKVDFLIVRAIDRFTRNGAFGYDLLKKKLEKLGVKLLDSSGTIQPSKNTLEHLGIEYPWSTVYPSETNELINAQEGKNEATKILTRLISAEVTLVRDGFKIRPPNDGFINSRVFVEGKKKVIQIPDPERAHFFVKLFEMSITHTDQEIVDYLDATGYRSKMQKRWSKSKDKIIGSIGDKKLTIKKLQAIRQRPIYCGVNTEKWLTHPIKTQYKGLVSIDTFNKANKGKLFIEEKKDGSIEIHKDYNPHQLKRMKDNPLYPHKSVFLCPACLKPPLGSASKGKSKQTFPAYHCTRNHDRFSVNKKEFEKQLSNLVSKLEYKDEGFIKSLEVTLINKFREKEKELGEFSIKVGVNVTELEKEKIQKINAFTSTTNEIIRLELTKQIEDLHRQILTAQAERNSVEVQENDIHAFVGYVKELMEHPVEMLVKQEDLNALRGLFSLVFDELPTYTEIINGTPKLSLPYRLSKEFQVDKSALVTSRRIELRLQA